MFKIFSATDLNLRRSFSRYIREKYEKAEGGVLTKSMLGKEIEYYKIGNGKKSIVAVGAHHGMEHISCAALFYCIDKMLDNLTRGKSSYGIDVGFLLQKFTFWFVPCINPDGADMMISGAEASPILARQIRMNGSEDFSSWQANARGVDLNHNYDFKFFEYKQLERKEGIEAGRTRYSGEYPESEPETKALASLLRTLKPELALSFHTQGELIYPRPRNDSYTLRLAERAAAVMGYELSVPEGLADYGGFSDYAGEVLGIPSLTVELGKGENPLPYSQLPSICERVYKLLVLLPTSI